MEERVSLTMDLIRTIQNVTVKHEFHKIGRVIGVESSITFYVACNSIIIYFIFLNLF